MFTENDQHICKIKPQIEYPSEISPRQVALHGNTTSHELLLAMQRLVSKALALDELVSKALALDKFNDFVAKQAGLDDTWRLWSNFVCVFVLHPTGI